MSKKNKTESWPNIPDTQILTEASILEPAQEEVTESLSDRIAESEEKKEEKENIESSEPVTQSNDYQYVLIAMLLSMLIPPAGMIMSILGFRKKSVREDNFLILFHILSIVISILSGMIIYYLFIR